MKLEPSEQLGDEYASILRMVNASRAGPGLSPDEFHRRLEPYGDEILSWTYNRIAETSRQHGAVPIFVLVPLTDRDFEEDERNMLDDVIRQSGGVVIELTDVFRGHDVGELRIAEWDNHPNELGHRLIADALYSGLLENAEAIGLRDSSE